MKDDGIHDIVAAALEFYPLLNLAFDREDPISIRNEMVGRPVIG